MKPTFDKIVHLKIWIRFIDMLFQKHMFKIILVKFTFTLNGIRSEDRSKHHLCSNHHILHFWLQIATTASNRVTVLNDFISNFNLTIWFFEPKLVQLIQTDFYKFRRGRVESAFYFIVNCAVQSMGTVDQMLEFLTKPPLK